MIYNTVVLVIAAQNSIKEGHSREPTLFLVLFFSINDHRKKFASEPITFTQQSP